MSLMIYGKERNEKNYKGFDINENEFVERLTGASLIPESMEFEAKKIIAQLEIENPNHTFILSDSWKIPE